MPKFKDNKDREWTIEISLGLHKRVLTDTNCDLFGTDDHMEMSMNPVRFGEVLYSALEPQIKEFELSPEEFGDGFDGLACDSAVRCLQEALVSFFLKASPAKGRMLSAALSKSEEMMEKSSLLVVEKMNSSNIDKFIQRQMEKEMSDTEINKAMEKISSE